MKSIVSTCRQYGRVSTTVVIGVVLVIAYAATWVSFMGEGHPTIVQRGDVGKGVSINTHVIAADLVKDTITMTLVPDVA